MLRSNESCARVSDQSSLKLIENTLKLTYPVWPLQNTVAVNPFWNMREDAFSEVIERISLVSGNALFMHFDYYLERLSSGQIDQKSIEDALTFVSSSWPELDNKKITVEQLISKASELIKSDEQSSFNQEFNPFFKWQMLIKNEVGRYCSAYLDDRQSLSQFPWKQVGFLRGWLNAQALDKTMSTYGLNAFSKVLKNLEDRNAADVIDYILDDLGLSHQEIRQYFLDSRFISVIGWSTQFSYLDWQKNLGYDNKNVASTIDLLAVRVAYEYALIKSLVKDDPGYLKLWIKQLEDDLARSSGNKRSEILRIKSCLHLALEISYQNNLVKNFKASTRKNTQSPEIQMVFCIDVRSEMIRRNIEAVDPTVQTIGFAGFFGLPIDYLKATETGAHHRLPVLLSPAYAVRNIQDEQSISNTLSDSYFKNLRKVPFSSFSYVEFFGAFYVAKAIRNSLSSMRISRKKLKLPIKYSATGSDISTESIKYLDGSAVEIDTLAGRVAAILKHMGLDTNFCDLVIIVGHGSETTNNAMGTSLDCGACGGHGGDINARVLTILLNDSRIRVRLRDLGILIPDSTWFAPAIHETVTDQIFMLEEASLPKHVKVKWEKLSKLIGVVTKKTQVERQNSRSSRASVSPQERAKSWSEVRPEWGLAGNASFIIAPRSRSAGVNLNSRSFLHDYNWKKDELTGYQTLELIMTAPMVVTNWINMQYFSSTVAPSLYGSGNKTIHNLVNETGVIEGNGGDLRVGLSFQSIHDGLQYVHEPLRLSVFIEAPETPIEAIISKHSVVRDLIENEWVHIIQINPETSRAYRRKKGGVYVEI